MFDILFRLKFNNSNSLNSKRTLISDILLHAKFKFLTA